jgi:hypothetical protein
MNDLSIDLLVGLCLIGFQVVNFAHPDNGRFFHRWRPGDFAIARDTQSKVAADSGRRGELWPRRPVAVDAN